MKRFGQLVLGLFIAGIIILAVGLFFAPRERAAIVDRQSPTGQILPVPTEQNSDPAALPPEANQPASR